MQNAPFKRMMTERAFKIGRSENAADLVGPRIGDYRTTQTLGMELMISRYSLRTLVSQFVLLSFILISSETIKSSVCFAQPISAQPISAQPISVEAIPGEPYGVARIVLPAGQINPAASVRILVTNEESRVFFPAIDVVTPEPPPAEAPPPRISSSRPRIGNLVQRIRTAVENAKNQVNPPEVIRIQFLFTGDAPLRVDISGDISQSVDIQPAIGPKQVNAPSRSLEDLRRSWWDGYIAQAQSQIERSDYPSIIENYLIHMLGRRFGYPIPELSKQKSPPVEPQKDPLPTLALVAGIESLRAELHRETLNQRVTQSEVMLPLPQPPLWKELNPPPVPDDLPIEAIASHVPSECFYIRFGNFGNFLWYKQFGESRGGDLAQLAVLRGLNYQTNNRVERMLNSKTTMVGKLFGDSVISDMAIIGQDLYMQEGPSMGVLFEAKNIKMLRNSMDSERKAALKQYEKQGATLQDIEIAGHQVNLLSTPDNKIRSFMAIQGNYLLLTTSQRIAERFLEIESGATSLALSPSFRFARLTMPVQNDYSVFIYLSSEFFRNLVSPHYQIELKRRLKAIASIEIAEMASQVAKAESSALGESYGDSIDQLIAGGYLPSSFQARSDGSQTLQYNDRWHDSIRGARGSFLPIADTPVVDCTQSELDAYIKQAEFYSTRWQQTDPLMLGIRRYVSPEMPNVEDLAVEGYIAPLGKEKYGWISSLLGEPVETEIELPADDMIHMQVHLSGDSPLGRHSLDHVLFGGIKDMVPPIPGETQGLLATLRLLKSIPGYMGTWPSPGYLDRLPFGLGGGAPDPYGFSRNLFGLWRWQGNGFSIASFDRTILDNCLSIVRTIPAKDFAQGRLFIGDLKNSQVGSFFNILSFRRAAQTSRGNLMLLDAIQEQLLIPAPMALATAEQLLDAQLQCPLGGKYVLASSQGKDVPEHDHWISTAWDESVAPSRSPAPELGFDHEHALPAASYRVPWLTWFRGSHLHLTQLPERLVMVGRVSMERMEINPEGSGGNSIESLPAMNLDLFNLPFQFFQGDKPKAKTDSTKNASPPTGSKGESIEPAPPKTDRRDF